MIRAKKSNPMAIISTHNLIENDPTLAPRKLAKGDGTLFHIA